MNSSNFKVIKGGLDDKYVVNTVGRTYLSGYVTNTRLTGILGMHLCWEVKYDDYIVDDLHQFFSLNFEEFGVEAYSSAGDNDFEDVSMLESKTMNCLGGKKISISEKEAAFLLQSFALINQALKIPLPDVTDEDEEYDYLLSKNVSFSIEEYHTFMRKICGEIKNPYEAVNYFLMRAFAQDKEGLSYLCKNTFSFKENQDYTTLRINPGQYPDYVDFFGFNDTNNRSYTLCKNDIEIHEEDGVISYLSESLITANYNYRIVTSEIILDSTDYHIILARQCSSFRISSAEANMMLTRSEFITVFEVLGDLDHFESMFLPFMADCAESSYEDSGRLFLMFNMNNTHISRKSFRINDDVHNIYYLTEYGQLLITSYKIEWMKEAEDWIRYSSLGSYLELTGKFQFKEPVLHDFIDSDFDDFMEFLDFIKQK